MAPPSQLSIATSSVIRLVKEEASYHKELLSQQARLKKLEESTEEDENREYSLKQEVSIFPSLPISITKGRDRIIKNNTACRNRRN